MTNHLAPSIEYLANAIEWERTFRDGLEADDPVQTWDAQAYATMQATLSIAASLVQIANVLEGMKIHQELMAGIYR